MPLWPHFRWIMNELVSGVKGPWRRRASGSGRPRRALNRSDRQNRYDWEGRPRTAFARGGRRGSLRAEVVP